MSFTETDSFTGSTPVYEVHPLKAIWAGVQKFLRVGTAEVGLTRVETAWIRLRPSQASLFASIAKHGIRFELRSFLSEWRQLDEVRDQFPNSWDEVALSLWTLINAGLLEAADEPVDEESAEGLSELAGHTLRLPAKELDDLLELAAKMDGPKSREAAPTAEVPSDPQKRIRHDFGEKMDLDHYAFLGVVPTASREEVAEAYDLLAPAYRLGPKRKDFDPDSKDQAKQLLARLFQAYETLSEPARREAYDLSRTAPSPSDSSVDPPSLGAGDPPEEGGSSEPLEFSD
jgi:hypothetical protein